MAKRVYDLVRTMVEEHGEKMWFQRKGQPQGGAWIIEYQGRQIVFPTCDHIYPGIDDLHVPKVPYPETWDDYKNKLIDDAWKKLLKDLEHN
jgi:hypothetical protein